MSVTHIAAPQITISDRYLRQRCGWCGEVLAEYDLARVAVPAGQDPTPGAWETGALVTVDGNVSWATEGERLPDDACAVNPITLASFA
jgi:hypothetical protein